MAALLEAELDGALRGEGSFTAFVENDDAFASLLGETGMTAEDLLALEGLSNILLDRAIPGESLRSRRFGSRTI